MRREEMRREEMSREEMRREEMRREENRREEQKIEEKSRKQKRRERIKNRQREKRACILQTFYHKNMFKNTLIRYDTGCPKKHGNSVTNSISSVQIIL